MPICPIRTFIFFSNGEPFKLLCIFKLLPRLLDRCAVRRGLIGPMCRFDLLQDRRQLIIEDLPEIFVLVDLRRLQRPHGQVLCIGMVSLFHTQSGERAAAFSLAARRS